MTKARSTDGSGGEGTGAKPRAATSQAAASAKAKAPKAASSAAKKRPAARSNSNSNSGEGDEQDERDAEERESDDSDEAEGGEGEDDAELAPDGEVSETELDTSDDREPVIDLSTDATKTKRKSESTSALTRSDPMAAYLREVQRHPVLPAEETQRLAVRFVETQDPAAAASLVTSNLRLVIKIAYEYRRAYKNIMDLVQEGNIGLMQAVKRYDPYRGVKLSTYAALWIRAYILRFIINNWRLVKLGTTQVQRKLFFNLRKKRAELQALGIDPTHAEIAKHLDVSESDVAEMDVRLTSGENSLDAPVGDADGRSIAKVDMMASSGEGPEALTAGNEIHALLREKLGDFRKTLVGKEKELAIFDERLIADEPLTLQELGDRFGISRERVRQLEQRLTMRLREYLSEEIGEAADVL